MGKSKIEELHESICGLADDIKIRTELLRIFNEKAQEVKEEILKDSLEDDNEVNAANYFKYAVDVQLRQTDLLKLADELRIKFEVYTLLEAGLDFPVDVIEIIQKATESDPGLYYAVSNDRKDLVESRTKDIEFIKENCKKIFDKGYNSEWLKILEGNE